MRTAGIAGVLLGLLALATGCCTGTMESSDEGAWALQRVLTHAQAVEAMSAMARGEGVILATNRHEYVAWAENGRIVGLIDWHLAGHLKVARTPTVFFPEDVIGRPLYWSGSGGWYDSAVVGSQVVTGLVSATYFEEAAVKLACFFDRSCSNVAVTANCGGILYRYRGRALNDENYTAQAALLVRSDGKIVQYSLAGDPDHVRTRRTADGYKKQRSPD